MTATTPNIPLMRQVLAQIEAHPETWDQESWRCETGMCFAGWAGELHPEVEWVKPVITSDDFFNADLVYYKGEKEYVDEAAEEVLGLTTEQANVLFAGSNELAELQAGVNAIEANPEIDCEALRDAMRKTAV